jgi:integrase/recombinase XerC
VESLPVRIIPSVASLPELPRVSALDLYGAFLAEATNPNTLAARRYDCGLFARWIRREEAQACALFISGSRGQANTIALGFRANLLASASAPASVNRRLSTLRMLVKLARRLELGIEWALDVDDVPNPTPTRDCRGPDGESWARVWAHLLSAEDSPELRRNRALLRTMYDSALRVGEAIGLDMDDLDLAGAKIRTRAKGGARRWLTVSPLAVRCLREWLASRDEHPGPVFTSHPCGPGERAARAALIVKVDELRAAGMGWAAMARALNAEGSRTPAGALWQPWNLHARYRRPMGRSSRLRLDERSVRRMLIRVSAAAGLDRVIRPHGIRHRAISAALEQTNGNVVRVQKFARHNDPKTTLLYYDEWCDVSGEITRALGALPDIGADD